MMVGKHLLDLQAPGFVNKKTLAREVFQTVDGQDPERRTCGVFTSNPS